MAEQDATVTPTDERGAKQGESPAPEQEKEAPVSKETEQGLKPEEPQLEEKPQRKHAKAEDRIKHLWKENKTKEALLSDKEKQIKELEEKLQTQTVSSIQRPKRKDFETEEQFEDALVGYLDKRIETSSNQLISEREKKQREEQAKTAYQKAWEEFDDRASKLNEDDFPELHRAMVGEGVVYTALTREFVRTSPVGPQIAYHLYQNPDLADKISRMSPAEQAIEMASFQSEFVKAGTTKTVTKTPEPIKPVGGGGSSLEKDITDPNLPQEEYNKMRREQIKKKREAFR